MKTLTLTLTLFIGLAMSTLGAPVVIKFQLDAHHKLVVANPQPSYNLPVTLQFPQASLTAVNSLSFFAKDSVTQLVAAIRKTDMPLNAGFYTLTIDQDSNLLPCPGGNCVLSDAFFVMADNDLINNLLKTVNPDDNAPNPPNPGTTANTTANAYGHPFYDAVKLGGLSLPANQGTIKTILRYYKITGNTELQANPFLKNTFPGLYNIGAQGFHFPLSGALESAGNLDVTNIADGLAKFIVARMKEELSTAFFTKFKAEMDKPENKPLTIMFPTTYSALKTIDEQIYNYAAYLDLLRESFQKDLTLLLPDLQKLSEDDDFLANYPEAKTILSDAVYIANEFNSGTHPGDVLHNYLNIQADIAKLAQINPNIYPSLQTLDLLSQSLRSKYGQNYWIGSDSVKMLFTSGNTLKIYFGLLYQQVLAENGGDIKFNGVSLKDYLTTKATDFTSLEKVYKPFLINVAGKVKPIDAYFQSIKKSAQYAKGKPDYQDYYGLVSSSADLIELLESCPLPDGTPTLDTAVSRRMNTYIEALRGAAGLYVDVYYKQYPAAILGLGNLLQITLASRSINHYWEKVDLLKVQKAAVSGEQDPGRKAKLESTADQTQKDLDALKKELDKQSKAVALISKYGNFVATVAKAQNSDDVQKAIEAVAMPSGSSSVKRNAVFNVALNAYIGPYFGFEKIQDFDKGFTRSAGLTTPVGVALSWGNAFIKGGSFSIFVPLIDLGAIASYRLGNKTVTTGTDTLKTSTIPEVKLKNIISPGLFLSFGFPKVPISLNLGYQLAPTLRSITVVNSSNTVVDPNINGLANQYASKLYSRFSISFVVDIPLLNFYTRGK